jgi:hypothetical protein
LSNIEPRKRAHSPQLAAGLASVYKMSNIPYGRRFPADYMKRAAPGVWYNTPEATKFL